MNEITSRRQFLRQSFKYGAAATAGAAVAATGLQAIAPHKLFAASPQTHAWPWPYAKLDPEFCRKLGHDSYWSGKGCSYAGFHPIIAALRAEVGGPYYNIPTELMIYGHGGGVGWGMLCGALNGAAAAISLVCEKKTADMLVNELFAWYSETMLPTDLSNQYAVEKKYGINKCDQIIPPCKSGSPLCHVSSTNWCMTTGEEITCADRKERCARLTGDSVAYAIQILNDNYDKKFKPLYAQSTTATNCNSCHGEKGTHVNVLSKMNCIQCHGDPHQGS